MTETKHADLPFTDRDDDTVQGHWLLARLGKRVLRPGGIKLTRTLLADARITGADVVELAPGLGRTAAEIVALRPRSYQGIDQNPEAVRTVQAIVDGYGEVHRADAADTGLPEAGTDVVVGEAMLTMHGDKTKDTIVAEAVRLLRPGGRYAIHELALTPDDLPEQIKTDVRQALARSIRVNARPLTIAEWQGLLVRHGLVIDHVNTAPMALLQLRRLISDEGVVGTLRFVRNLLTHPKACRRVLGMYRIFRTHSKHMSAVSLVAHKP